MDEDLGWIRVRLGADFERAGFDAHDRAIEAAERKKKVETKLGGEVDEGVFAAYEAYLAKAEARAKDKDAYKAALGAEFNGRSWANAYRKVERERRRIGQDHDRHLAAMAKAEDDAHRLDAARTQKHLADMARQEDQAHRMDLTRSKRLRDAIARDESRAYGEEARRAEHAMRERERAQERHMRQREHTLGRLTKVGGSLVPDFQWSTRVPVGGLVAFAAAAQAVVPPVVALAGSLAPLVGWLGAIPTAASAAGIGLLTAFLGLKGVGSALGAAWEAQASAAEDSVDTSKRQEAALDQVKNAERQLTDALEARDDAERDANTTMREARAEARALRGELDDLNATEGDRAEALKRANEELGRLKAEGASQREIAQARRDVTHAEYELAQAQERRRETAEKVRQVDQHGIGVMEDVVSANERLADAERDVQDARTGVAKANRDATRDMAELSGGAKKLDEAMRELSPSGQAFVTLIATKFFPLAKRLRTTAQDGLLPGLGDGLVEASANASILDRVVGRIAKTMGGTGLDWGRFLGSKSFGGDFEQIMRQSNELLDHGGDASIHFASGLRHVAVESEPLTGWLGKITERLAEQFDAWAANGRESGKMRSFFRETVQTTKDVVGSLADLGAGLWNIARIGARVWGNDMRGGIRDAARDFRDWTDSVSGDRSIEQYFTRWRRRWTSVVDYIGDAIDEYQRLRREGMSTTAALTRVLTDKLGEALVTLAERVGRLAPKVVAGFVKGFLDADGWGKLAIGTWLLAKLGGRGAFLAIGRTVGGWLGLGLVAGTKQSGIAMQIATWLKAPERTARMTSAGSVMGRALGLGISAGIVLAIPLIGVAVAEALNKGVRGKVQGWIKSLPFGKEIVDVQNFIGKNVPTGLVPGSEYVQQMFGRNDQMRADMEELNRDVGGKLSVDTDRPSFRRARKELADLEADSEGRLKSIRKSMGRETAAGAKAAKENFRDTAKTIEQRVRDGEISTEQGMRSIRRLVKTHSEGARGAAVKEFDEMGRRVTRRLRTTKDDGGKQARGLKNAVTDAVSGMTGFVNKTLKGLGLEPVKFANQVASGAEKIASGEIKASGGFLGEFAGGGLIGRWGERGRDKVHAILGRGEAVLNHYQQKAVNAALRMTGIARGGLPDLFSRTKGTRHYMASGGVAGGDGVSVSDFYPRFAAGGLVGAATQAAGKVERAGFPYDWGGGHSGSPAPFGPFDCSGAVSWVLQQAGINIPTMVSGAMMNIGKPGPGPLTIFANPEHVFMRIGQKYFGTSGENPGGGAGWFSGGTDAYRSGFVQRHFGEGDASSVPGIPDVPGVKITGPNGPLRDIAQKLVNRVRKGAISKLQDVAGESTGSGDVGNWVVDSPDLKAIDRRFDKHFTGEPGPSLSERLTAKLASWARLPSWFPKIWKGESTNMPGIVNSSDGGIGLGQETPSSWPAGSVLHKIMGALGGYEEMRNPLAQAQMNREHLDLAPSQEPNTPGFPWYGTKYLASGGFAGGDGPSISDYMPSAGGLASGGFADSPYLNTGPIPRLQDKITRAETTYGNLSERFNLTDETFVLEGNENTPPTIDMGAIKQRQGELQKLVAVRERIQGYYRQLTMYMETLIAVLKQNRAKMQKLVAQVRKSLQGLGKGKKADKQRKALEARLGQYQGSLKSITGSIGAVSAELQDVGPNAYSAETNLLSDRQELDTLLPGAQADFASQLDRAGSDDRDAQDAQRDQKLADLENFKRSAQRGFDIFQGPGDIGASASYALRAARNPGGTPEGPGAGLGLRMGDDGQIYDGGGQTVTSPLGGSQGTAAVGGEVHQHFYSPIPATADQLDQIGKAATAGQSLQGAVPANRRTVNV